ncbi:MAG: SPOR domain-containing protein [Sediminibacterium sp.]|nr:MAG: SPOR domain-containing protein [Sediminibacterium sp.]
MKTAIFLFVFIFASTISLYANDTVIVHKDARLDVLTAKQLQINNRAAQLTSTGQYKGFRIQVLSTASRDLAFKTKADLLARFPDQKTVTLFQSPNFKVRMGNFITKAEAEKFRLSINKLFPDGVFIVEDTIDYTPIKETEDNQ